jgi:uncharacterized protein (DUF58 family)
VKPLLTRRAWWLLIASVSMLTIGVVSSPSHTVLWMAGLSAVLWLTGEGLLFNFRARWVVRGLKLRRVVCDDRGPTKSLWAGRPFEVQLTLRLEEGMGLPYIAFEEPPPFALEVTEGEPSGEGAIGPDQPLRASYRVRAARPGAARFEGVRVQLADLHGLFYHVGFVRAEAEYRILPGLVDAEGKTPASKRYNLLPPPGIHRLPRPGSGSELLDLRDYLPGDPPKTIAWKVSARRDKLITKEYESEVPVRCTLFVDVSQSVRLGPPGRNALTRLVEIAAGVAQANLASRDLTGLCLFDEDETKIIKPARTRRHLVQVFNDLADAAARPAGAGMAPIETHLPLAYTYAREVYPELLADGVNHMPRWLTFLVPFPSHWVSPPSALGHLYRILVLPFVGLLYLLIALIVILELGDLYDLIYPGIREEILPEYDGFFIAFVILACLFFPLWMLLWRDAVPLLFSPKKRRLARMRKKMAALLAERYALGGGGLELLLEDDRQLGSYLERFLNEHHVPHTPQLFGRGGEYLFRSTEKLERLTAALMRSVGKGHDNELFVLFVDLVELEKDIDPLLRAVKVALSRHHQVFVVLPWPPGLPLPKRESAEEAGAAKRKKLRVPRSERGIEKIVNELMARRYHQAFHRIRKTFARLQVPVVCAAESDPIQLILDRLDRLRGLRRRRR